MTSPTADAVQHAYATRRHMLYGYARRFTADHADAEDLVHDAVASALDAEWRGRGEVTTWLCAMIRNAALAAVRHREVERRHAWRWEEATVSPDPERIAARRLDGAVVLESLSVQQYLVVALRTGGWREDEIAALLGCERNTVKGHLHRARTKLACLLEDA